ncbi:MAG: alanine racemase [Desulfovibrionaceae bacterium]
MTIQHNKLLVRVDLDAIRANYRLLNERSGNAFAVIKADAYGHGLIPVARALEEEGAETFAVGTVDEAVALRESGCAKRILALLGPVDSWEYTAVCKHDIVPFIGNWEQLARLCTTAEQEGGTAEISLKFDTGMARLGFQLSDVPWLLKVLSAEPRIKPVMASSHLATADVIGREDYVEEQGAIFQAILEALAQGGLELEANLANSAGILAHSAVHHQGQRAGIALYGANPFHGTPREALGAGLRPAMEVSTKVLEVHPLRKGQSVSYGCTYTAERDMVVAIVAVGYADAYSRGLSGKGFMCLHGVRVPILGRVCMQLTAVDVSGLDSTGQSVQVGDDIFLLGGKAPGHVSAEELSEWWGTITYEVFCLLGMNKKEFV